MVDFVGERRIRLVDGVSPIVGDYWPLRSSNARAGFWLVFSNDKKRKMTSWVEDQISRCPRCQLLAVREVLRSGFKRPCPHHLVFKALGRSGRCNSHTQQCNGNESVCGIAIHRGLQWM